MYEAVTAGIVSNLPGGRDGLDDRPAGRPARLAVVTACCMLLAGCNTPAPVHVLHINDVYRIAAVDGGDRGGMARLTTLRDRLAETHPNLLLTHAGDFLFPSLLSGSFRGQQMIDLMNLADGTRGFDARMLVTFGNHEFEHREDDTLLQQRIDESHFYWIVSNLEFRPHGGRPAISAANVRRSITLNLGGARVGVFGLTTDMGSPAYARIDASYTAVASRMTAELRAGGADYVIALTHLPMQEDQKLLEMADGPDVVIGGHEHARQCVRREGRLVVKADADLRSAALVSLEKRSGKVETALTYLPVDWRTKANARAAERVGAWTGSHDEAFCNSIGAAPDCLNKPVGRTNVDLVGEERAMRRFETNLGNLVAEAALDAHPDAQIALINSGSLRLNQNIPAGSQLTERFLRELFQYSAAVYPFRISGAALRAAALRSAADWTGNGAWLQIAGFGFDHDADRGLISNLRVRQGDGWRPVEADDEFIAVTNGFMLGYDGVGGQDGYTMLDASNMLEPVADPAPLLLDLVRARIESAPDGITPAVDGRISCVGTACVTHAALPFNVPVAEQCTTVGAEADQSASSGGAEAPGVRSGSGGGADTDSADTDAARPEGANPQSGNPTTAGTNKADTGRVGKPRARITLP